MPDLVANAGGSVISAAPGAHHYRFIGLEISPVPGVFLFGLVTLDPVPADSAAALPHHIIFDRVYLHGDPVKGTRRGIMLNSGTTAVIDSHVSDIKEVGSDSQALGAGTAPAPSRS